MSGNNGDLVVSFSQALKGDQETNKITITIPQVDGLSPENFKRFIEAVVEEFHPKDGDVEGSDNDQPSVDVVVLGEKPRHLITSRKFKSEVKIDLPAQTQINIIMETPGGWTSKQRDLLDFVKTGISQYFQLCSVNIDDGTLKSQQVQESVLELSVPTKRLSKADVKDVERVISSIVQKGHTRKVDLKQKPKFIVNICPCPSDPKDTSLVKVKGQDLTEKSYGIMWDIQAMLKVYSKL